MRSVRRVLGILAMTGLLATGVGCGDDDDTTETTASPASTGDAGDGAVTLTDPARPILVGPGGSFTVTLDANPTTGYEWVVVDEPDPAVAAYVGSDYTPAPGSEDVEGGGGVQALTFDAVGSGDTQIGLRYEQSFDPQPDDPSLVFAVQVEEGGPSTGEPAPDPEAPPDDAVFTDPATAIEVAAAAEFGIALESNASTGYQWVLAAPLSGEGVTYRGSRYEPASTDAVGAPGTQLLVFRAGPAGSSPIELRYTRVFDPSAADETVTFELNAA